jgi:outer membrane protein
MNQLKQYFEAQEIVVGQKNRSFFLPKFGAYFEYGHIFSQSDATLILPEDNNSISVAAFLPIFEGTGKIHSAQKEKIILKELTERLQFADELVEQRTRTALRLLESSYPNLSFSRDAADNAKLNLSVISDKYANGIVNITELLDAQNASYRANQNNAIAKYRFLSDLVELQRAGGIIYDALTQEEQTELENEIINKMNISN